MAELLRRRDASSAHGQGDRTRKVWCLHAHNANPDSNGKAIVQTAERTSRGIALEDLNGIRARVTARRRQRARLANWPFRQLRSFVAYKARLAGVPVVYVDPRNTSRTCPECGCIDKANRPNQATFSCVSCGYSAAADHNAARMIRARAAVRQPMVASNSTAVA